MIATNSRDVTLPASALSVMAYSSEESHGLYCSTTNGEIKYPLGEGPAPEDMKVFVMPNNRLVVMANIEEGVFTECPLN